AIALLFVDAVARLALASAEVPSGVVTATFGALVFIWLLLKYARYRIGKQLLSSFAGYD
ncbi:iron chelate uptake ABC transporter family permease subunit, partial [Salmonella enterica]|uniref:iron chelate uptake ABC transporter family permease subunit n=1 Tax=Salmonella enterica TaxID=28901 RepID=UPI000AEF4F77